MDEATGKVKKDAENNYDKQYYYYYDYYTYYNDNDWSDTTNFDEQDGMSCYAYARSKNSAYSSAYTCTRKNDAYTITKLTFWGTFAGVWGIGFVLAVYVFSISEIVGVSKRNKIWKDSEEKANNIQVETLRQMYQGVSQPVMPEPALHTQTPIF